MRGNNLDIRDERWAYLKNMIGTYFAGDISSDDSLWERMEAVKADNDAQYVETVQANIADVLGRGDEELDAIFSRELRSYYSPAGDGLTPREWLMQMLDLLAAPADTSRDHRSGYFPAGTE